MKIKNISPIERHVEKLVFAVAAAASLYLVWSSLTSPTTVDDKVSAGGGPVGASEVEGKVAEAIKKLQAAQIKTKETIVPTIKIAGEDFVQRYRLSQSEPLPTDLLKPVAMFAPRQYEPKGIGGPDRPGNIGVASIPVVPPPTNLTLASDRKVVAIPLPVNRDANAPVNPNEPIPTENRDMSWVMIEAKYPMAELIKAIQSANLPRTIQRVTFVAVQAQRMDLTTKGKWEDIPGTSAVQIPVVDFSSVSDDGMLNLLNWYDQRIEDILSPKFFEPATIAAAAPTVPAARPATPAPAQPQQPPMPEFNEGGPQDMGGEGGSPGSRRTGRLAGRQLSPAANKRQPNFPTRPTVPVSPMGPGGMNPDGMPMDPNVPNATPLAPTDPRTQQQVTLRFYDEHVQAEHEYTYRLRVAIFNPLYRSAQVHLKEDPKVVERPILTSAWAEARETDGGKLASIKIDPNMFIFVGKPISSANDSAQISIYKWEGGAWQKSDETVYPGQQVGHKRVVAGQKEVDFTTEFTLVDVQNDANNNIVAIFQGTGGQLSLKSNSENANAKRQELEKQNTPAKPAVKTATPGA